LSLACRVQRTGTQRLTPLSRRSTGSARRVPPILGLSLSFWCSALPKSLSLLAGISLVGFALIQLTFIWLS